MLRPKEEKNGVASGDDVTFGRLPKVVYGVIGFAKWFDIVDLRNMKESPSIVENSRGVRPNIKVALIFVQARDWVGMQCD